MIRVDKATDYGIVLLSYMAGRPDSTVHAARDLAKASSLPLPMVSKIMKALVRTSVVESHRGPKGGYSLSRPADEIAVVEIITALQGPIAIMECVGEVPSNCTIEMLCPMRSNWQVINNAIQGALEGITLADMSRPLAWDRRGGAEVKLQEATAAVSG